jgi:hypothetical protein
MRLTRLSVLLTAPLALAGCDWVKSLQPEPKKSAAADKVEVAPKGGGPGEEIVTVDASGAAASTAGATPMKDRVAVLGLLNKRNVVARDISLKPGQATRVGDVIVRLRACEKTAPFESEQYTGAFAQVDVRGTDGNWSRVFSGWLFKERPALNVVPHPIYDVWVKSCAMTFPETGGETVDGAAPDGDAPKASSAPKSPATTATPVARPAEPSPSESDKSDR